MASHQSSDGTHENGHHGSLSPDGERLKAAAEREKRDAAEFMHDAAEAAQQKAYELGAEAKDEALRRASAAQHETSESLHAFAEAIRAAGDDLARKDQGTAAALVREAASGLERLSTALGRKRLHDIVDDVRNFGRQNPNAFVAGSVLIGLALGRFAQSSGAAGGAATAPEPTSSTTSHTERNTSGTSGAPGHAREQSSGD